MRHDLHPKHCQYMSCLHALIRMATHVPPYMFPWFDKPSVLQQGASSERQAEREAQTSFLRGSSVHPVTSEDETKAFDAIIVMIGIVSTLIVNVCYVGAQA